jgi:hypothetical protein
MKMKINYVLALALCSALAMIAVGADTGLEGIWNTDGVAVAEAAKKAGKSLSGLPEATQIKFKVDTKKGKVSGNVFGIIDGKEYDVVEGKLTGNTFTFGTVPVVAVAFGNNNRGGFNNPNNAPKAVLWKGELKDENTISIQRVDESGNPFKTADGAVMGALVLHRATKK